MSSPSQPAARPAEIEVDLRILQANERTLLAWVRTGIALMAFGFVVARLGVFLRAMQRPSEHHVGPSLFIGAALVLVGTASNLIAARRYVYIRTALVQGRPIQPSAAAGVWTAVAIAILGVAMSVYLFTL